MPEIARIGSLFSPLRAPLASKRMRTSAWRNEAGTSGRWPMICSGRILIQRDMPESNGSLSNEISDHRSAMIEVFG